MPRSPLHTVQPHAALAPFQVANLLAVLRKETRERPELQFNPDGFVRARSLLLKHRRRGFPRRPFSLRIMLWLLVDRWRLRCWRLFGGRPQRVVGLEPVSRAGVAGARIQDAGLSEERLACE